MAQEAERTAVSTARWSRTEQAFEVRESRPTVCMSPWQGHSDGPKLTVDHSAQRESTHSLLVGTKGSRRETTGALGNQRGDQDGMGEAVFLTRQGQLSLSKRW